MELEIYTDSDGRQYTKDSLINGIKNAALNFEGNFEFLDIKELENLKGSAVVNQHAWTSAMARYSHLLGLNKVGQIVIMANVIVESGNFKWWNELGYGKGKPYGKPDGPYNQIYFGRGPIQVTWYDQYKLIYDNFFRKNGLTEYDIVKDPNLAIKPEIGAYLSIGWLVCTSNGKNAIKEANAGNVKSCCRWINGRYNHLKERQLIAQALAAKAHVQINLDK